MSGDLGAAGLQGGGYEYEWNGVVRVWRVPITTMTRLDAEGRVFYTRNGIPRMKRYLDEAKGNPVQDVWVDIQSLRSWHNERLGYPTQKPESLLERIIQASSNEGDVVLDPFCGCGTAVAVAERLKRRWIGIDVTHLAISLMKSRLHDTFGTQLSPYDVVGVPQDIESAKALAKDSQHDGRYQFEYWALGLVDARPGNNRRKGADAGVDGYINFFDDDLRQGEDSARAGQERPCPAEHHRDAQGGHRAREGGAGAARHVGAADQARWPRRRCPPGSTCRSASRTVSTRAFRSQLSRTC